MASALSSPPSCKTARAGEFGDAAIRRKKGWKNRNDEIQIAPSGPYALRQRPVTHNGVCTASHGEAREDGSQVKERHREGAKQNALSVLSLIHAHVGQDFHTLSSAQVDGVLQEADRVRYQKPANANGSRGRYFYSKLQREAQYKD